VILPAVIDTTGRVEPASVRIMGSSHPAFDQPTQGLGPQGPVPAGPTAWAGRACVDQPARRLLDHAVVGFVFDHDVVGLAVVPRAGSNLPGAPQGILIPCVYPIRHPAALGTTASPTTS